MAVPVVLCGAMGMVLSVGWGTAPKPRSWPHALYNQDAFFVAGDVFGVFDGVSGAEESRSFARVMASSTRSRLSCRERDLSPAQWRERLVRTLEKAREAAVLKSPSGATTACIATVCSGLWMTYSLGDSGAMLFTGRQGEAYRAVASTTSTMRGANCPCQLPTDSAGRGAFQATRIQTEGMRPAIGLVFTDGLTDNLSRGDITEVVNRFAPRGGSRAIARALVDLASRPDRPKPDDVTVVCVAL